MKKEQIEKEILKFNLILNCVFIPASHYANDEWRSKALNFDVTLQRKDKKELIKTPYSMGIGHLPKLNFKNLHKSEIKLQELKAIEKGIYFNNLVKPPSVVDVLHSLLSDSNCAEDSFEDFCSNLGYDDDSMKAKKIWESCIETKSKLKKMFTLNELEELVAIFEDY